MEKKKTIRYGISQAASKGDDIRFADITLASLPRLRRLRERLLGQPARVCIERARLLTEYLSAVGSDAVSPHLRYAAAVRHVLVNKSPQLFDDTLVAGSTTSRQFGAPVYPEFTGLMIWPELDTISTRKRNPQLLDPRDAAELDEKIFLFWMDRTILETARREFGNPPCLKLFEQLVYFIAGKAGCMSHTVPFYEGVIGSGTQAVRERVGSLIARESAEPSAESAERLDFYRSVDIVLDGVETYALHLSQEAARRAESAADPDTRIEFEELSAICGRVPRYGATTLAEAVNALWILQVCVHAENINMAMSPGRLDRILYPYYQSDIERGTIDNALAAELIGHLWLKVNDNTCLVPESSEELFGGAGTVPAVTVGGVDEEGRDAVNACSYLILRVAELLKTRDPSLNARYHPGVNSITWRDRVAEVIAETRAIPAFFNDKAAIAALVNQGVSLPHARDYAIIGCVELASAGRSYDASSSIILNLPAAMELALFNGKRPSVSGEKQVGPLSGDPERFESFEAFWSAFRAQLSWLIDQAIELNGYFGKVHAAMQPSPLLSAFFQGPMESGRDLIDGGALYNSSGATHIGFADTVDSLCAVKHVVFDTGRRTLRQFLQAIAGDFENDPELQALCSKKAPKFGTTDPTALELSRRLSKFLFDVYQSRTGPRGGHYRPAYWTMTNHAGQGMLCGALPSGRKKGESFASGMTPCAGAAGELTECLRAVAAIDATTIPGGLALNLKFPAVNGSDDAIKLAQTVEAYFAMGGMHLQCNIATREMLVDAKKHPHDYPGLLVRVSGYSAYFADLTPRMQDEIIARTAYPLNNERIAGKQSITPEKEVSHA